MRYHPVTLHIQEGDIITSQKGILQHNTITDESYTVKKLKYVTNGVFECLSDKEHVDVKEYVLREK